MGPIVDESMSTLRLRPFKTSTTFRNLRSRPCGVFHVVDDVLLLARAAIGRLTSAPDMFPATIVPGSVLASACRWYEFEIEEFDDSQERSNLLARVVHAGRLRDVFGFNRAKHAVLEAAILATRVHLLPADEIAAQIASLEIPVQKTAGPQEREAFDLLKAYIADFTQPQGARISVSGVRHHSSPALTSATLSKVPSAVAISTGSRLHFGLLANGRASGRQFGGAGLMIDRPGFRIRASVCAPDSDGSTPPPAGTPADRDVMICPGDLETRLRGVVAAYRRNCSAGVTMGRRGPIRPMPDGTNETDGTNSVCCGGTVPPLRIEVLDAIPAHAGLGSGTQLGMAIAQALSRLTGEGAVGAEELALRVGRGARSALGAHGFRHGGFLVDGGKLTPNQVSPLVARAEFPAGWRFVLVRPTDAAGLSGEAESSGFSQLSAMAKEMTERLCRILLMELLPAVIEAEFNQFGEALYEFGQTAGEYFAPVQGGTFAHPEMARLATRLRAEGIRGVAQTSWGPTLCVLCPDDGAASELGRDLAASEGYSVEVARPLNRGAEVVEE